MVAKNRCTKNTFLEKAVDGVNRGIVAHVLVDRELDSCFFAGAHRFCGVGITECERFLGENAFHGAACAGGEDQSRLVLRRNSDVQHLDGRVSDQFLIGVVNAGNRMTGRHLSRFFPAAGGDGDRVESRAAITHEMAIVDDKSGAENSDAEIFFAGNRRRIYFKIRHRGKFKPWLRRKRRRWWFRAADVRGAEG